jgi:hydrophobic/amphiphilic exporter-1 (mainly G- bacteria), HAE1 family
MKIADFSIQHPAIITIIAVAILVFGVISLSVLTQELIPDTGLPTLIVITTYPGVGPGEMERQVTDVLENALATTSGISSISSGSVASLSQITLEFGWEVDVDAKLPEVRERISEVIEDLPDGISGPPTIIKVTSGFVPIFTFSIAGDVDPYELAQFVRESIIPEINQIDGASTVTLKGAVDREVAVVVDPARLAARELDVLTVVQVLSAYGISVPAGSSQYRGDDMSLTTSGEYSSVAQLRMIVVGSQDGSPVLLRDVATVELRETEPTFSILENGKPTIVVDVTKRPNSDSLHIISETRRIMTEAERQFGGAITFTEVRDQGREINISIRTVRNAALMGGLLAVFVLFLFLRQGTATFIIGVSIPFAVVVAFLLLFARNQTLNKTTLGGLTVSIGMIVDSSIVILENIFRHFRENPTDPDGAASVGAEEVGGAVFASTSTTLAVFVPLLFVQGMAGIMLEDVALTIIYALAGSLIAALVLVPFLFTRLAPLAIRRRERRGLPVEGAARSEGRMMVKLEEAYSRGLRRALSGGWFVLLVAVLLLGLTATLFNFLGFEFLPEVDVGEIVIAIETPIGSTMEYTESRVQMLQEIINRDVPEAEVSLFYVGQSGNFGQERIPSRGYGVTKLMPVKARERDVFQIMDLLRREALAGIPGARIDFAIGGLNETVSAATGGAGFQVTVTGRDITEVHRAAEAVQWILAQDPDIVDTDLSVDRSYQEITAAFNLPALGRLGLTPEQAGIAARALFSGLEVGEMDTGTRSLPVIVTSPLEREPYSPDVWNRLFLKNHKGELVSFGAFTTTTADRTFSVIPHVNREPAVVVRGTLRSANIRSVRSRMIAELGSLAFPFGVQWEITGQSAELVDSFRSLILAGLASIFLVYVVMVIQFERFVQPLIVLSSIPFTMIGVVLTLLLFGSTLSIISFLGIIALAGIVVNNAIVMIDYTNLLRSRYGLSLQDAVVKGAGSRLRPILMTTLTTILGLVPMALALGEGAEFIAPLGQAIAGGLISSTVVTLFVVPTLYWIVESRLERRHAGPQGGEPLEEVFE